jgi:hypothetical protein
MKEEATSSFLFHLITLKSIICMPATFQSAALLKSFHSFEIKKDCATTAFFFA